MKYNTIENKLHKKSGLILLNKILEYFISNFNKKSYY